MDLRVVYEDKKELSFNFTLSEEKKEMVVRKNLDLLDTFMKYAFDHPDILDKIPPDAELVILPKGDPELYKANKKLAESMVNEGKKVVIVHLQKPRIAKPDVALLSA